MPQQKAKKHYVIGKRVMLQRGSLDGSRAPRWTYVPTTHYGTHARNIDAKRAYVLAVYPALGPDLEDTWVRWYFQDFMARGAVKVLAIEEASP